MDRREPTGRGRGLQLVHPVQDDAATWAAGAEATFARLAEVAPHLVVIGDNPSSHTDPPACLSGHVDDATACATARADAVRPDRISGEVAAAHAHGATFVDTTDWFCTPDVAPSSSATCSCSATRPTSRHRWPSS